MNLKPQYVFLFCSLLIGLCSVITIPLGLGFDENAHTRRIWEISGGSLIPNYFPESYASYPEALENALKIPDFLDEADDFSLVRKANERIDWWSLVEGKSSSTYFPFLYIPQSLVMLIFARNLDLPVWILLYLVRLIGVVAFIIPTYYAVKIMPQSRWLFTALALVPMASMQSGTISPEGLSNGFAFLFISWIMNVSQEKTVTASSRKIEYLPLLIACLFMLKLNLVVLVLLVFLVNQSKFQSKKQILKFSVLILLSFGLIVILWNKITAPSLGLNGNNPGDVVEQAKFILKNPFKYTAIIIKDFSSNIGYYVRGWIAAFPNEFRKTPSGIYIIYLTLIGLLVFFDPTNKRMAIKDRVFLLLTALAGYLLTVTLLYLKDTPLQYEGILRVQGRYFIPIFPLVFLALSIPRPILPKRISAPPIYFLFILCPLLFCGLLILRYQVNCGLAYLSNGECFQPTYRNWAPNSVYSPPLLSGKTIQQTFFVDCGNLNKIRLWTNRSGSGEQGKVMISISETGSDAIILSEALDNSQFEQKNWLTIGFPRIEDSKGKNYQITLTSQNSVEADSIVIAISYRHEYLEGDLLINGSVENTDLIFQYGCCVDPFCK